jgi:hypothetical integral membrane protein (TIGR02206 family)
MSGTFQLFSKIHIIILAALAIIILCMFVLRDLIYTSNHKKMARYALAFVLLIIRASEQVVSVIDGTWDIKGDLPLHLCGITSILCIVMLIFNSYTLFQVLYFWGLIGSPLALIIPGGLNCTYNSLEFWQFIIAHSLNIISILYFIFAYKYRPVVKSIWKTFFITNIYMGFIAVINYIIGSNYYYFYLCNNPSPNITNPFKLISSWPLIIVLLEALTLFAIILFYLPYAITDRKKASRENSIYI